MAASFCCSSNSLSPSNSDPFILLQRCNNLNHLTQIHAKFIRSNLTQSPLIATRFLRLYSSYSKLDYATSIFHQIQNPPTFTWNLMIRAHTINGSSHKALLFFNLMLCSGITPDKFTFSFVVKACSASNGVNMGKLVHAQIVKNGYYTKDMYVMNTLLDMYLKCNDLSCAHQVFDEMRVRNVVSWTTMLSGLVSCQQLDSARRVFDKMPVKNVVSWTAMMNGYVVNHKHGEALELFSAMVVAGVKPNEFTLVCLLRACTEFGSVKLGSWVHEYAVKNGFELGLYLGTALVDMYSKCGSLNDARKVFNMMENKGLATWNSMITSLGVHGYGEEALEVFDQMTREHVMPDAITFVGVLSACVQTNNVEKGLKLFEYMSEDYGIVPILEHYICMFELWHQAKEIAVKKSQEVESLAQGKETNMFDEEDEMDSP